MSGFTRERLLRLFTKAPSAFWRHDVDLSLDAAARMAVFAHMAGVTSTFYLMPRSPFYNLFSHEGARTLDTIRRCGHRLGLHCDYRTGNVLHAVGRDLELLDAAYPGTFEERLVSFHMPPPTVLWTDFQPDFENAYGAEWEGLYLSDSRREFGPAKEAQITEAHQVNLHAEHWLSA